MKAFFSVFLACQSAFCASYLTGQAARLVIGQQNFTALLANTPPTPGTIGAASGVAYANNMLFIADGNKSGAMPINNRVLIYTPVSGFPTPTNVPTPQQAASYNLTCPICIGDPKLILGQVDNVSDALAVTQSGMQNATAVASDGTVLVVADTDNNRVLIWKTIPTANDQPADIVLGQADFTHGIVVYPPTASSLNGPQGVWIGNGKLFVADTLNDRVLIYNSIPTTNNAPADVVVGAPNFTTLVKPGVTEQDVPPTQTNLSSPTSATTDATHLYISDLGHSRILIWNTIPTANNAPADLVIGQPDFVSELSDNAPAICASNGTDTTVTPNVPTYPAMCATTLSLPRAVLSDGQNLYIADGGNDRVLVFNPIPTTNHPAATAILGEPDEFTDSSSADSDSLATPSSLAWDGTNLYVADPYNLRVVVYTPAGSALPLTAVRNAASLQIYSTGSVAFSGTPATGDTVSVVIGTTTYTYTVVKNDTLANVVTNLTGYINGTISGHTTADANVIATGDTVNFAVILTARVPGDPGEGTALSASVSSTSAIVATPSGTTITINLATAVQVAPGSLITIFGTNLSSQTAAFDYSSQTVPRSLGGSTVYIDGLQAPLLFVSPTQINAQMPYEVQDRGSVSVYVVNNSGGSSVATNAIGTVIVPQNPGLFALSGLDPRPGIVNHLTANSAGLVSVDGTITAGDTVSVIVGTTTYTYTVLSTDTLTTVRNALVALMQNDPLVTVAATNAYTRIVLVARVSGPAGNSIAYSTNTNTGATELMTAFGSTLCCGNSGNAPVTTANPAAPGEFLYTYATGLGETNPPTDSNTGQLVTSNLSLLNPIAVPVDSILAGGSTGNLVSSTLVPGTVGLYIVAFQISNTLVNDNLTQLTIAQQDLVSNIVTFPVAAPAAQ